jgi:hypothetical protein
MILIHLKEQVEKRKKQLGEMARATQRWVMGMPAPPAVPYIEGNQFSTLWLQEWERYLKNHRRGRKTDPDVDPDRVTTPTAKLNLVGLSLSGGGIRSATFNLGLLQAFARLKLLKYCDYLSTVSGGGYIGAALTAHLHNGGESEGDRFPFGFPTPGKEKEGEERSEVRHLRNHGNYLAPRHGPFSPDTWRLIATYLGGLLVLLPVLLAAFILLAAGFDAVSWRLDRLGLPIGLLLLFGVILILPILSRDDRKAARQEDSMSYRSGVLTFLKFGIPIILVGLYLTQSRGAFWLTPPVWYWNPSDCGTLDMPPLRCLATLAWVPPGLLRTLVGAAVILIGLYLLSVIGFLVAMKWESRPERRERLGRFQAWVLLSTFFCALLAVLPTLVTVWTMIWNGADAMLFEGGGEIGKWLVSLFSLLGALGANRNWKKQWMNSLKGVLIKCGVAVFLASLGLSLLYLYRGYPIPAFTVSIVIFFLGWIFLDPDRASLHLLYRDRLTQAYVVKPAGPGSDRFVPDHDLRLARLCRDSLRRPPYPLINAAINLSGDRDPDLRGRQAHLFQFSPFFCGSEATGWRASEEYESGRMDLATAMAVSGAAVGSQMGMYTSRPFAMLLTLLNIRLGSWKQNPRVGDWWKRDMFRLLFIELLGRASQRTPYVNLSDGGHFENLGLYGLIQRRCKYIIVSDAGNDQAFGLADLANALRKIRIDFGVQVEDLDLTALRPDPITGRSRRHCAVGRIVYPDQEEGILLYLKPSLCGSEPADLLNYREEHGAFPHETTADQFFDEAQFESYRALGYHIGRNILDPAEKLLDKPDAVEEAFQKLYTHWKLPESPTVTPSPDPRDGD